MANYWTRIECEAIAVDYVDMLAKQSAGVPYRKAEHRRNLKSKLNNRSDGSIEYKHQNISAVLIRAGQLYVRGYKPAWNYQALLEDVVLSVLEHRKLEITSIGDALIDQHRDQEHTFHVKASFQSPPKRIPESKVRETRARILRIVNYAEREARKRQLGDAGEAFVMKFESVRLANLGRQDLVRDLEWTSKDRGDGAGYDIRSFFGTTDEELFIEAKTTNSGKYQPFLISDNELAFSREYSKQYSLYRIFDFSDSPAVFQLKGAVERHVDLAAKIFSASF